MFKQVVAALIVTLIGVSLLPVRQADSPTFANPAFEEIWSARSASTSGFDLWGSEPLAWRIESYADAPGGRRIVQYFDRGRMELGLPDSGREEPQVYQGLLALELTTGRIHLGDSLTASRTPPSIPIDSGSPDDRVPTYAALSNVVQERAPSRLGRDLPVAWIDSTGQPAPGSPVVPLRGAEYIEQTGHNLPDVTVSFFARRPFGTMGWIEAMGLPISEPYWTIYRRDGTPLPSLIQVFERRILVYTPALPAEQRFTTANTGRHYYRWRYETDPPRRWPDPRPGRDAPDIRVPDGFAAGVYASDLGTPVGLALGPAGNIWAVTAEGRVLRIDSEREDGSADRVTVIAEDLPNPRGIAITGTTIYVPVDGGVVRIDDNDLNGVADRMSYVTRNLDPAPGSRGAPVIDGQGRVFVAGTLVPGGDQRVVARLNGDGEVLISGSGVSNPGPHITARQQLLVVDRPAEGEQGLYRMPTNGTRSASQDPLAAVLSRRVVKFPGDVTVHAVLRFDNVLWPQTDPDTLFAAISSGESGSVVRTMPGDVGAPPDLVEFATGLSQPVALAVGLDGSLFVADAGRGEIIKIVVPAPEE